MFISDQKPRITGRCTIQTDIYGCLVEPIRCLRFRTGGKLPSERALGLWLRGISRSHGNAGKIVSFLQGNMLQWSAGHLERTLASREGLSDYRLKDRNRSRVPRTGKASSAPCMCNKKRKWVSNKKDIDGNLYTSPAFQYVCRS